MSIVGLTATEGDANDYVKDYCSHNYPQSSGSYDLAKLMGHSDIASQIEPYAAEISAAAAKDKPHIFGETNSGMLFPHKASKYIADSHTSYTRRRWHQPNIRRCPLDPGLCYADCPYGHRCTLFPPGNRWKL